ncbi:hypothetical protein V6N13_017349 [Hibiscus sabdariffa]
MRKKHHGSKRAGDASSAYTNAAKRRGMEEGSAGTNGTNITSQMGVGNGGPMYTVFGASCSSSRKLIFGAISAKWNFSVLQKQQATDAISFLRYQNSSICRLLAHTYFNFSVFHLLSSLNFSMAGSYGFFWRYLGM